MKYMKSEKIYTIIIGLLIVLSTISGYSFALNEISNEIQSENIVNKTIIPPKPQILQPPMQSTNIQKPKPMPINPPVSKAKNKKNKKVKIKTPVEKAILNIEIKNTKKTEKQKISKENDNIAPQPRLTSVKPETKPSEAIKSTAIRATGGMGNPSSGNPSPGNRYATVSKSSFGVSAPAGSLSNYSSKTSSAKTSTSYKTPLWVDTENKIGSKVYIDINNQYYFLWGQVYTIKYDKNGQTNYVQIELKGLRGNRAAILSVSSEYKKVYEIPSKREYKEITPEQAIYNSTKMALENTNKPNCPADICKIK